MRAISPLFVLFLFIALTACFKHPQPNVVLPVVPVPALPAPPPAPIVEPQTVVHLPANQTVPADSVPPRPAVEAPAPEPDPDPTPPATAVVPPRKNARPQAAAPTQTVPATHDTPPAIAPETVPVAPPVTPPVEEPAPAPQTLRSAEDRTTSKTQVSAILEEVRKLVSQVDSQPKSPTTTASVDRIVSLVRLAEQANARKELRQAESLAKRALALARDLNSSH